MRSYTINSVRVTRKEFFDSLKEDFQKVCAAAQADEPSADSKGLDPVQYRRILRDLDAGHMVLMQHSGKTYCSYRM